MSATKRKSEVRSAQVLRVRVARLIWDFESSEVGTSVGVVVVVGVEVGTTTVSSDARRRLKKRILRYGIRAVVAVLLI
jgi:hypothetical protein